MPKIKVEVTRYFSETTTVELNVTDEQLKELEEQGYSVNAITDIVEEDDTNQQTISDTFFEYEKDQEVYEYLSLDEEKYEFIETIKE